MWQRRRILLALSAVAVLAVGLLWWLLGSDDATRDATGIPALSQARAQEIATAMSSGTRGDLAVVMLPTVLSEIGDDQLPLLADAVGSVTVLQDTFAFSALDDRVGSVEAEVTSGGPQRFLVSLVYDQQLWWVTGSVQLQ